MTRKTRRILFYISLILFFVLGYFALLFAFGFKYDFDTNKFIKTGSIYVSVNTSANIEIGDSGPKSTGLLGNDVSRKYMLPGTYDVSVTKDGFHPWFKKVDVDEGLVSSFQNVILVREDLQEEVVLDNIRNIYVSPNKSSIFYVDTARTFGFVNLANSEANEFDSKLKINHKVFEWNTDMSSALLTNFGTSKLVYTNGEDTKNILVPTSLLNNSIEIRNNFIISLAREDLSIYDYVDGENYDKLKNVASFHQNAKGLLFIDSTDGFLYEYDIDEKKINLIDDTTQFQDITKAQEVEDGIYILTSRNLFEINDSGSSLIAENIDDFTISNEGGKLAFWNKRELKIYWIEDAKVQPFFEAGDIEQLGEFRNILNVSWHQSNAYLVVFTDRQIQLIEIDNRYEPNTILLFDVLKEKGTSLIEFIELGVYNGDSNTAYFHIGRELKKITI